MTLNRSFFSSLNYQMLLGLSEAQAGQLQELNFNFHNESKNNFDSRLKSLVNDFTEIGKPYKPSSKLKGWNEIIPIIRQAQTEYGGVILGLFHFGLHRDILIDLACENIPFVAPIAGRAYWDFYNKKNIASVEFSNCFNLLEVDDASVGKKILKAIRNGKIPAIYVDGNMGPDGCHVKEGSTEVEFFNREIKVKEGISRLSKAFNIPVLPIFIVNDNEINVSKITMNSLLHPGVNMMQKLYLQLESHVRMAPEHWEFIVCYHRWIKNKHHLSRDEIPVSYFDTPMLSLNSEKVRIHRLNNDVYIFHLVKQKAFKLPELACGLIDILMKSHGAVSIESWLSDGNGREKKIDLIKQLISKELVFNATSR